MPSSPNQNAPQGDPWHVGTEGAAELAVALPAPGEGQSFYDLCIRGELPWTEETLLRSDDEVACEYLALFSAIKDAQDRNDTAALRRLHGDMHEVRTRLDEMDPYSAAQVLSTVRHHLESQASLPDLPATTWSTSSKGLGPEPGRFSGPAPHYRRGRAYVQAVLSTLELSARRPSARTWYHKCADQLLRAVEATDDPQDLHDFIAGIAYEVSRHVSMSEPLRAH